MAAAARATIPDGAALEVLGPSPAPIARLRGRFRFMCLFKGNDLAALRVASKAAIEGLTDVLAKEFAPFGITVNTIGPVPIETDLIRSVPDEKIAEIIEMQSVKRMGTFKDVANVTDFYLASDSEFITGQKIYLGGL